MEHRVHLAIEFASDARRAEAQAKVTIERQGIESGVTLEAMQELEHLALREAERRKMAQAEAKKSQMKQLQHAEEAAAAHQAVAASFGDQVSSLSLCVSVLEAKLDEKRAGFDRVSLEKELVETKLASLSSEFKEALAKCEAEHAEFVQGLVSSGERLAADASQKLSAAQMSRRAMEVSHKREMQAAAERLGELQVRLGEERVDRKVKSSVVKHSGISLGISLFVWWSRRQALHQTWQRLRRDFEATRREQLANELFVSQQESVAIQATVLEQTNEIEELSDLLSGKGDVEGQRNKCRIEAKNLQNELEKTRNEADAIRLKSAEQQGNLLYQLSSLVTWRQVQSLVMLRRWFEQRTAKATLRAFLDIQCRWRYDCEVDTAQYECSQKVAVLNEMRKREGSRAEAKHRRNQGTKLGMFLVSLKLFAFWSATAATRESLVAMQARYGEHKANIKAVKDAATASRSTLYYTMACVFCVLLGSYVEFQLDGFGNRKASPWAWLDLQLALLARGLV